jgi:hypothetical protein
VVEKLINKRKSPEDYATIEDMHDIINKVHIATVHGGCDRMP